MSIRALFAFYRSFHQCINTTTWSFINKYHAINITISSSERLAYSGGHGRKFADKYISMQSEYRQCAASQPPGIRITVRLPPVYL